MESPQLRSAPAILPAADAGSPRPGVQPCELLRVVMQWWGATVQNDANAESSKATLRWDLYSACVKRRVAGQLLLRRAYDPPCCRYDAHGEFEEEEAEVAFLSKGAAHLQANHQLNTLRIVGCVFGHCRIQRVTCAQSRLSHCSLEGCLRMLRCRGHPDPRVFCMRCRHAEGHRQ